MVNLNRLFCFTREDIGKYKSKEASLIFNCKYLIGDILSLGVKDVEVYDCLISAVDNVESRMHLNLLFKQSHCKEFVDCGVFGDACHALRTDRRSFCLFCIKELYEQKSRMNLCSLKYLKGRINKENRFEVLKSFVNFYKTEGLKPQEIVDKFNADSPTVALTSLEEVEHLYENIVPSVCFINSICASLAVSLLRGRQGGIFVNYSGRSMCINKIQIERDTSRFLCKKYAA